MSVYFARVKDYVKIGFSDDVYDRMTSITSGSAIKPADVVATDSVDLLGWVPGNRATETAVHNKFGSLHVVGEWYWDDASYDEFIEADAFGVPIQTLPAQVAWLMGRFPQATRQQAVNAYEARRAAELADPDSELSQIAAMFDDDFLASIRAESIARREADRFYWRTARKVAS